jgi:cardiolipin synthase
MPDYKILVAVGGLLHLTVQVSLCLRAVTRRNREPASRLAWILIILSTSVVGIVAYILLGEVNIGRRRVERLKAVLKRLTLKAGRDDTQGDLSLPDLPPRIQHLFRTASSINPFEPLPGNHAHLLKDSAATIDSIVADIDSATDHVHLIFYIWLTDRNGLKMVEALKRAAARGVTCRVMADDLGSRKMIASAHWKSMQQAGVKCAVALPIGNLVMRLIKGRIDLRNHRKIVVIDNHITYTGSQNCADAEFLVKAKYAPWVDAMMRFEGPIARQNQYLFLGDWMAHVDEDLTGLLQQPIETVNEGFVAQAIGTGPTYRESAISEVFEALMYAAREKLIITTPYYVPNESMQAALCRAARRGVETILVLPAKNDSVVVAAASRSYYEDLLEAGVKIYEYEGGLLHTKSLTLDGEVTLIGSANMDRRSFDLNYENNILLYDPKATAAMIERQHVYLASSHPVSIDHVKSWGFLRRLWNNTIGMLGPVL